MGKPTEELYHGYQNVGTSKHGSVRLRLIVRQIVRLSVRLRVRLRRVHKALKDRTNWKKATPRICWNRL